MHELFSNKSTWFNKVCGPSLSTLNADVQAQDSAYTDFKVTCAKWSATNVIVKTSILTHIMQGPRLGPPVHCCL